MAWTVEHLNGVVDAELEDLPADMRARFHHISLSIEDFGLIELRATSSTWTDRFGKCGLKVATVSREPSMSQRPASEWWWSESS